MLKVAWNKFDKDDPETWPKGSSDLYWVYCKPDHPEVNNYIIPSNFIRKMYSVFFDSMIDHYVTVTHWAEMELVEPPESDVE